MKNVKTYKIRFVTRFKFNVTNARYVIICPNYFPDFFRLFHVAHLMSKIHHTNRFQGICFNFKQVATLFIRIHNER